jgi:hypothetical protein
LKVPSSGEWRWIVAPELSVTASPSVVSVCSGMALPSSRSRLPTRTPSARSTSAFIGVAAKINRNRGSSFPSRS